RFYTQPGDAEPMPFSYLNEHAHKPRAEASGDAPDRSPQARWLPPLPQVDCYLGNTNPAIHDIIRANLHRAPMYSGQIQSTGPRYCPSIEDKVVRFADRPQHQIFLEPEGRNTLEYYCNGISTSLPRDVQESIIPRIAALKHA